MFNERDQFTISRQTNFTGSHRVRAEKLSCDSFMRHFFGAPENERPEKPVTRDKTMKVFEAAKASATVITKRAIFMKEKMRRRFKALRFLLGNYQKVGIKHKCFIMLTINTIMSSLPANLFCDDNDGCSEIEFGKSGWAFLFSSSFKPVRGKVFLRKYRD